VKQWNNLFSVLIVDDSEIIRERISTSLKEMEFKAKISFAKSASDAITMIEELSPHIVILDIRLYDGTGIDVLQAMKGKKTRPIFIVLTNFPYPEYKKKCKLLGAKYFFDKTMEFEKAVALVQKFANENQKKNSLERFPAEQFCL
jgi:DNA-binding NtrC family response regulator